MNTRTVVSVAGVLAVFYVGVQAGQEMPAAAQEPAAAVATASPKSIENGAALFKRQCVMCHGTTGLGDGPASTALKGKLPNFSDKAFMSKLTDAHIHTTITEGKKTAVGNMPALGKRLKPEEITDIVNYVRTLAK